MVSPNFYFCFISYLFISSSTSAQPWFNSGTTDINETYWRSLLVQNVELYNGGLNKSSGMNVYSKDWSGLMRVDSLNRKWEQYGDNNITAVAQSRAIYINTEAFYATTDAGQQQMYQTVIQKACDYLIEKGWDTEYGGFYWMYDLNGQTPPVSDDLFYGYDAAQQKQSYGEVHALFALSTAYPITRDYRHIDYAIQLYSLYRAKFSDPVYPGTFLSDQNRVMNETLDYRTSQEPVHGFEALLYLYDALVFMENSGNKTYHDTFLEVTAFIGDVGNALINTVIHYDNRTFDRAFLYLNYATNWSRLPNTFNESEGDEYSISAWVSPGHTIEIAFLISRAVERGFNVTWLTTVQYLVNFYLNSSAYNMSNGIVINYHNDEYGGPLDSGYTQWWQYTETARAFLHLAKIRNCDICLTYFNLTFSNILSFIWDPIYGGYYSDFNSSTLLPINNNLDKGNNWHVGYHETMFCAEAIRLSKLNNNDDKETNWFLPVVIGVPVIVVGLLIIGCVYYEKRKKHHQQKSGEYRPLNK